MRRVLLIASLLTLAACDHAITLVPRDGGAGGQGVAPAALGNKGDLSIYLEGQQYTGRWTYVPEGGGFTLLTGTATAPGVTASHIGTGITTPSSGGGLGTLSAPDGSTLRCEFRYSEWSATGVGVCQRNDGKLYDMHIG